jgi:hypothetical protein
MDVETLGADYVYLFGLYLGDGYISRGHRGVYRLRITLDRRYPDIIDRCFSTMSMTSSSVPGIVPRVGCVDVSTYWKHWPCLIPQHGPGPKHMRPFRLESWQQRLVGAFPSAFLAGLIHSDGCRTINRVKGHAYPRYHFTNRSADIRALFLSACSVVGVDCRPNNEYHLSVARRRSVEILDGLVGPKS